MNDKKAILYIFLFFISLYILFLGSYSGEAFYSSDEVFYFRLTQSLVDETSLEIEPYLGYDHSKYMPGQSIAGIPLYSLSKLFLALFPNFPNPALLILVFLHLTNILIGAGICVVFYKFGRDLGYGVKSSLAGSLALGLTTTFLPYSKQYFADPLVALFILLSVRFLYLSFREKTGKAILAGVFFGCAVLTKIDTALLLIPLVMALFYDRNDLKRRTINFFLGMAPFVILLLIYNHLNYGSAFNAGYERQEFASPFLSGLFGLLFSPSRGLFIFSPCVILFFFGLKKFRRKFPMLFFICLVIVISKIAILAKWFSWQGGWCWGPRLLLPIIPLLLLPAFEIFENWKEQKGVIRITTLGLLIAGFSIQIIGSLVSPNKFNNDIYGMMPSGMNEFLYIPQLSTIKGNLFLIFHGNLDLLWLDIFRWSAITAGIFFSLLLGIVLFLGGILLKAMGLGEKGWLEDILPEWRRIALPLAAILIVFVISHLIMQNQGIRGLRYTYVEEGKEPGIPGIPYTFQGYLYAPTEGDYLFSLKIRGSYEITLGETIILKNEKDLPQHWDFKKIQLSKGYHFLKGSYTPGTDSPVSLMHLYWTIPDGAEYKSIIGPMYLFREPPGDFRKILLGFVRFRAWIILLIILGFVLKQRYRKNDSCPPH